MSKIFKAQYGTTWGGIKYYDATKAGNAAKVIYNTLQQQKKTKFRPTSTVQIDNTQPSDNTRVQVYYKPIYKKTKEGDQRLVNTGGNNKTEVESGFDNAHKANISHVRTEAEHNQSYNSSSKYLGLLANQQAEQKYRKENNIDPNLEVSKPADYDPNSYFVKDLATGDYLRDKNGHLIINTQWDAPMGLKVLRGIHNLNSYGSLVASLIPNPVSQAIGQSMFIGQGLANIHHDMDDGNYGSAATEGAFIALPYGISKGYKYLSQVKPIKKFIKLTKRNPYQYASSYSSTIMGKRDIVENAMDDFKGEHADEFNDIISKMRKRSMNRPVNWNSVEENMKQLHDDYRKALIQRRDPHATFDLNGTQVTIRPSVNYKTGQTNPANPEIAQYLADTQAMLGNTGLVSGSTRLYGSGIVNGVPHDLEVITTKSRMDALKKAAGAEGAEYSSSNGFAQQLQGNNKVFNSDGNHMIDVQVLGEDANGFANGQIAHNWYSRMYPEQYQKLAKQWAKQATQAEARGKKFITTEQPLPIKTEDFYQQLQNNPDLLSKMVALDNFNSSKVKHIARQAQMYQNSALVKDLQNRNLRVTHPEWQDLQELTPQEIQEARQLFNIPSAYSDAAVQGIVRQQFITDMIGTRGVFWNKNWHPSWNAKIEDQSLRSVVAPFNGQASGIGGNQLLQSSAPGVGSSIVASLNNNTLGINTFKQYTDFLKNKITPYSPVYQEIDAINKQVASGAISISDATKQIEAISRQHGINGYYGGLYNKHARYYGATTQPTIGLKTATVASQSGKNNVLEVGNYPNFGLGYEGLGFPSTILPYVPRPKQLGYYIYRNNWTTPKVYNRSKALYKYPEYRKLDAQYTNLDELANNISKRINSVPMWTWRDTYNNYQRYVGLPKTLGYIGGIGAAIYNFANPILEKPSWKNNSYSREIHRTTDFDK